MSELERGSGGAEKVKIGVGEMRGREERRVEREKEGNQVAIR